MNEKYSRKRKGWIKVHLAIDADFFQCSISEHYE